MTIARDRRGVAMLMVLIALAAFVIIASTLTVMLAELTDRTSRVMRATRARAVAEAGVECALSRPEATGTHKIEVGGGQCQYSVEAVEGQPDSIRVVSDGGIKLGRNRMVVEIELVLKKSAGGGRPMSVVSRREHTKVEPAGQ